MAIIHDVDEVVHNENAVDDYLPVIMIMHDDNENAVDDYQPPGRRPPGGSVQARCPAMILGKLGTWAMLIRKRIHYGDGNDPPPNSLPKHLHSL